MSLIKSKKERDLWLWLGALVGLIYLSIPFTTRLAAILTEAGLNVWLFLLGMILTFVGVVAYGFLKDESRARIITSFAVATIVFMTVFRITTLEERSHLMEYALVAVVAHEAIWVRRGGGIMTGVLAIAITAVIGMVDEGIQLFVPDRVFALEDIFFNTAAAAWAVGTSSLVRYLDGWRSNRK